MEYVVVIVKSWKSLFFWSSKTSSDCKRSVNDRLKVPVHILGEKNMFLDIKIDSVFSLRPLNKVNVM